MNLDNINNGLEQTEKSVSTIQSIAQKLASFIGRTESSEFKQCLPGNGFRKFNFENTFSADRGMTIADCLDEVKEILEELPVFDAEKEAFRKIIERKLRSEETQFIKQNFSFEINGSVYIIAFFALKRPDLSGCVNKILLMRKASFQLQPDRYIIHHEKKGWFGMNSRSWDEIKEVPSGLKVDDIEYLLKLDWNVLVSEVKTLLN